MESSREVGHGGRPGKQKLDYGGWPSGYRYWYFSFWDSAYWRLAIELDMGRLAFSRSAMSSGSWIQVTRAWL